MKFPVLGVMKRDDCSVRSIPTTFKISEQDTRLVALWRSEHDLHCKDAKNGFAGGAVTICFSLPVTLGQVIAKCSCGASLALTGVPKD